MFLTYVITSYVLVFLILIVWAKADHVPAHDEEAVIVFSIFLLLAPMLFPFVVFFGAGWLALKLGNIGRKY